ncbi:hypothetical protein HPDP_00553 [Candidatus Hepatincola sp. Pdp]
MRVFIQFSILFMIVCILTATILSLQEKFLETKVEKLNKEIAKNRDKLQSLKAEWNYLNNKDYLKMLTAKYLPDLKYEIKNTNIEQFLGKPKHAK